MEVCRRSSWLLLLLGVSLLATTLQGVQGEVESEGPSESECRPYIEKALKELETGDSDTGTAETGDSIEDVSTVDITTDDSDHPTGGDGDDDIHEEANETTESVEAEPAAADEQEETQEAASTEAGEPSAEEADTTKEEGSQEVEAGTESVEDDQKTEEASQENAEEAADKTESKEESSDAETDAQSLEENAEETKESAETGEETEEQQASVEEPAEQEQADEPAAESAEAEQAESVESEAEQAESVEAEAEQAESVEAEAEQAESVEADAEQAESVEAEGEQAESADADAEQGGSVESEAEQAESVEAEAEQAESVEEAEKEQAESVEAETEQAESVEADAESAASAETDQAESVEAQASQEEQAEDTTAEEEDAAASAETVEEKSAEKEEATEEQQADQPASTEEQAEETKEVETTEETEEVKEQSVEDTETAEEGDSTASAETGERAPVEDLTLDIEIPTELRERDHVERLLKVDEEASETEQVINRIAEITLRELKRLYESAIKPLEGLYKYRDLSNRHFGDSEIFSKPLILFMGPWSGGKSSIINYLLNNEYNETSLRTGAEPSPAYFNLLMHGDEPEIVDGTQLAADFTFAGLQKFGQGLEQHLRGVKLPSKLLEKVNIVEIPGILEVRKQVSRVFPFNDACQWFIDRADIIFLVYDPSKLDVGPETEAILDQLKGREHQTRIILNKADQVKPEELMRVQGALIWNISPLMSSPQPPVMYTTSLWSRPYETWAPTRLLQAQERAFLRDLRSAVDKRIENKIASARRFAVRVRNHAKMVDCYLTTYYNHKSVFGNRKQVADEIIEHPQDYHIYEGLSTLTNISRYDLPDPEVYKDFFKLNALYDFQQLSATCTYFRGCPINRLDVAIAYDLPELVGKHKRLVENALAEVNPAPVPGS